MHYLDSSFVSVFHYVPNISALNSTRVRAELFLRHERTRKVDDDYRNSIMAQFERREGHQREKRRVARNMENLLADFHFSSVN
jgi:hypothetical protein